MAADAFAAGLKAEAAMRDLRLVVEPGVAFEADLALFAAN